MRLAVHELDHVLVLITCVCGFLCNKVAFDEMGMGGRTVSLKGKQILYMNCHPASIMVVVNPLE